MRPVGRWTGPALGLAVSLGALALMRSTLGVGFEQRTVDSRLRIRGATGAASEVVVCAIDAESVDRLGQWPWPRTVLADLVRRLHAAGARVIAFDVVFSEPSRCGVGEDDALAAAIREAGNVVLGYYLTQEPGPPEGSAEGLPAPVEIAAIPPAGFPEVPSYSRVETNLPALAAAAAAQGHFVIRPDADGTVRHYAAIVLHRGDAFPGLALRAVQVSRGSPPIALRPHQGRVPRLSLGEEAIPVSERGELWINFPGPFRRSFRYVPVADVVEGRVDPSLFRDRLVFVGATETGIGDVRTTPFDLIAPGVEVHAAVADNLIHRRFLRDGAPQTMLGLVAALVLGPLCGAFATWPRRPGAGVAAVLLVLAGYVAAAQIALFAASTHLHLVGPVLAATGGFTLAVVWRNLFAEARSRQLRAIFGRLVSESVIEEVLRAPDAVRLGGEKREMTVLFSDIRGFTALAERLPPERVVEILNDFLGPMSRIVIERGGTLDKYMGDALMAFFGAPTLQPDHAARACETALAMRAALAELNAGWQARGLPSLTAGIGLNSGPMAVGYMGSEGRLDYTVIGDQVNLGSRLEGLTATYGVDVIVGESTRLAAGDRFEFRELDLVRVKGRSEPVRIYQLVGTNAPKN